MIQLKRKEKRKNMSVGIQVKVHSRKKSYLHMRHDKVSNFCNTKISSNPLRKTQKYQGDWTGHRVGDPNKYKTFCVNYLLQLSVIVYLPSNLQVSRLSNTGSLLSEV